MAKEGDITKNEIGEIEVSDQEVAKIVEIMKWLNDEAKLATIQILIDKKADHDQLKAKLEQEERWNIEFEDIEEKVMILRLSDKVIDSRFDNKVQDLALPKYLKQEIENRRSKNWWWKLFIPSHIKRPERAALGTVLGRKNETVFHDDITNHWWILFEKSDLEYVQKYFKWFKWIVTDLNMEKVIRDPSFVPWTKNIPVKTNF